MTSEESRAVAATFDAVAETYDRVGVDFFGPIAQLLVAAVTPADGERVLDIGCGRGAVTMLAADAVGPGGRVTGIDLAEGMVNATRAALAARGRDHVELLVRDAAEPGLPESSYDVATASLVVFFLPDPAAALRTWLSLLRPGGRLGITTFGPQDELWTEVDALFRPFLPPQMLDARTSGRSGPFASGEATTALVTAAGFSDVRTVESDMPIVFSGTEKWHEWSHSHGQRAMWDKVPAGQRDAIRDQAYAVLARRQAPDGSITLQQRVRVTSGHRPAG